MFKCKGNRLYVYRDYALATALYSGEKFISYIYRDYALATAKFISYVYNYALPPIIPKDVYRDYAFHPYSGKKFVSYVYRDYVLPPIFRKEIH